MAAEETATAATPDPADAPGDTGGSEPAPSPDSQEAAASELDDKAAKAKAILERAVASSNPYKDIPKEADERVLQAQSILNNAVTRGAAKAGQGFPQASASVVQEPPKVHQHDVLSRLPHSHRQMLRGCYYDPYTGEAQPYFVGSLKSYSSKAGYGFLECPQAHEFWGVDVFIHKNQVPVPWSLGQPVEFSVVVNAKQQPQAADCLWLPKLPQPRVNAKSFPPQPGGYAGSHNGGFPGAQQPGIFSPNDPSRRSQPTGGANGAAKFSPSATHQGPCAAQPPSAAGADTAAGEAADRSMEGPLYLGTLKSYSAAQGYGFIQCDDIYQKHKRDIYFDRSQLPRPTGYTIGQVLEFAVTLNARGQPQARHVRWDPIPLLPIDLSRQQPSDAAAKAPSQVALDKVRKLLRHLNDKECEAAVITAIDTQGEGKNSEDLAERGIDFVTYVLDRLGNEDFAKIKGFVKMLLLLMIAKMIRQKFDEKRVKQMVRWLELCASAIDPEKEPAVRASFNDVSNQIENNLHSASIENPKLQDESIAAAVQAVRQILKNKVVDDPN